jgi:acetyl esterase/lipase
MPTRGNHWGPERAVSSLADGLLTGLRWLTARAIELGVDPSRIAFMGGGGCPAVGAAIIVVGALLRLAQLFWRETVTFPVAK